MSESLKKVFKTGEPDSYEISSNIPKIGTVWFSTKVVPIKHDKWVKNIIMISTDITERKQADEALRNSEEKLRAIFDNANDGMLLADVKTKTFYTGNKAICRMLGYSLEEIKKLGITDIHPKEDLPHVMGQFERQARREILLAKDIPVKRKDGRTFYADVNSSSVTLAGRTYLLGVFRDITERKRMEEALKIKNEELEKSKNELEIKILDTERFVKLSVGRELKMIELKKRVEDLEEKLKGK